MDVTFFDLQVEDRPGVLGAVASHLEATGVNIEAFNAGQDGLRILTNDPEKTRTCLAEQSIGFTETPVIQIQLENKPGQLAQVATALGKHGVNIVTSFGSANGHDGGSIYIGVDDVDKAWAALEELAPAA